MHAGWACGNNTVFITSLSKPLAGGCCAHSSSCAESIPTGPAQNLSGSMGKSSLVASSVVALSQSCQWEGSITTKLRLSSPGR